MKDPATESEALNNPGTIGILGGIYGEAVKYLEKAVPAAEKLDDKGQLELILINLGHAFTATGKYAESVACFTRAPGLARETKGPATEALLLGYLGEIYSARGQYHEAEHVYEQALAPAVALKDKRAEARNLPGIARCLEQRGVPAKALENVQQAVDTYRAAGGIPKDAEETIGSLYLDLGALDKVEQFILKTGAPALMGRLYLSSMNYDKAKEQYEQLLAAPGKAMLPTISSPPIQAWERSMRPLVISPAQNSIIPRPWISWNDCVPAFFPGLGRMHRRENRRVSSREGFLSLRALLYLCG